MGMHDGGGFRVCGAMNRIKKDCLQAASRAMGEMQRYSREGFAWVCGTRSGEISMILYNV